jgi:cellulose biosynthesis protein BcsQ
MTEQLVLERHRAARIALYNHKGGVGKTTLTANLAFALVQLKKSVLLVDSDPQCNLSAYLLDAEYLDRLLDASDSNAGKTIWTMLSPVMENWLEPRLVSPMELPSKVRLCPGDIRLSDVEEKLAYDWQLARIRDLGAFASVTAISLIINSLCAAYDIDFVFYDCGPNIGPLNRCILIDCDCFVVPAACDEFSVRALSTLGATMARWLNEWREIADLAPDGTYLPPGYPKFLGYILQRFKVYGGYIASTSARYLPLIERAVSEDIVTVLRSRFPEALPSPPAYGLRFGEVRDLSGITSLAQSHGVPLWEVRGASADLKRDAKESFFGMANRLSELFPPEGPK